MKGFFKKAKPTTTKDYYALRNGYNKVFLRYTSQGQVRTYILCLLHSSLETPDHVFHVYININECELGNFRKINIWYDNNSNYDFWGYKEFKFKFGDEIPKLGSPIHKILMEVE